MTARRTLRTLTALAALALAATGLAACGDDGGGTTIRFSWWGNADRAAVTQQAIDLFESRNPGITVEPDFSEFADYWQKMSTQAAGGGLPDVLQMDYSYLRQYGDRGLLLDLNTQSAQIATDTFRPGLLETGVVDGKRAGIPMSANTLGMFYRPDVFEKAGIDPPKAGWTWDDYHALIAEISRAKVAEGMTGAGDYTSQYHFMELWLRQSGGSFYNPDGSIAFGPDVLKQWWTRTEQLRAEKLMVTPEVATQIDPKGAISSDVAATEISWDNFMARYIGEGPDGEYALAPVPSDNATVSGQYLKPSMLLSVFSGTEEAEASAKLVNFLVNDAEAAKILGVGRGIPATTTALSAVTLSETDQKVVDYEESIAPLISPPPPPPPAGAGSVEQSFRTIHEALSYGEITVDEAVERFFSEAQQALDAAK